MLSFQHPITYKFYSQVDPNHSFFRCFPWLISHIHLKHSIHHQLSFVFAFQWPSFYHTDQSVASQPHLKPTCIRPASTGVSTVFPSPGASYILTSKPSQNSSPCLHTCRSTNTKRNCCGIRPTRLHLQNHSKAKNHSRTCQSNSKTLAWASEISSPSKLGNSHNEFQHLTAATEGISSTVNAGFIRT